MNNSLWFVVFSEVQNNLLDDIGGIKSFQEPYNSVTAGHLLCGVFMY